jgi:NDP-sugar pyrophosphorylase family protein
MLNIVIPMAGRGSRFVEAGYDLPKPLIPVHGVPMIKVVIDNLTPKCEHRFIFVCQNEHIRNYNLIPRLRSFAPGCEVIGIDGVTQGQLCSVLKARHLIDNDLPLMTANSDQFIDFDINAFIEDMNLRNLDGLIMTMNSDDPKWSYVRIDPMGYVVETAEKKVISNDATVGIYNFRRGRDLVRAADRMIEDGFTVNNEFYICPSYNYLIQESAKIGIYSIGKENDGMYGLGIPKDLEFFLNNKISSKINRT